MADDTLAVDVPVTDDESGGDVVYIQSEEDEAALRAQAKINSPKGKTAMKFDEDDNGNGMSLNLGNVDDEIEEYDDKVTPNTKRDQMDVNSPRQKTKQNWATDEAASNAAVAGLVTQVSRDDPNKQTGGGVESLVTQVPRDDDDTERNIQQQQQSGGICACFSCLWSCCSGPQPPPESVSMTTQTKSTGDKPPPYNSTGSDGSTSTTTSSKGRNETADTKLLPGHGTENKDTEDSMPSSTEYDQALLPPLKPEHIGKKCLVLDLDETLVHSSFKPIPKPDFIIPVEIDRVVHHVYVLKRPYVDEFLLRASKHYEIVVFTASLSKYADPLLDKLDIHNVISHRLFRESCVIHGTAYVKDLRKLGRKLKDSIIVDNSPPSYLFQPTNAVPIASWFDDQTDTQLLDFCPVIETTMKDIDDVRKLLDANNKSFRWLCNQAHQPLSKYTVRNDQVNRQ